MRLKSIQSFPPPKHHTLRTLQLGATLILGSGIVACSSTDDNTPPFASGGFVASGATTGVGANANGAVSNTGGSFAAGGAFTTGNGGQNNGGVATSGGQSNGGVATNGGQSNGGVATNGGQSNGGVGAGGACTNVRPTGTMWDEATCDQWATQTSECGNAWMVNGNYCNESCGRCGTANGGSANGGSANGGSANGGSANGGSANGGSANGGSGGITSTCTEANRSFTNNATGNHCGYTYEYWKDNGTGTLTVKPDGFSVNWTNIGNLLGRKGIRPGSKTQIVNFDANYQPNGNSYLCVYGWTRSPLIEYYIVDSWGSWRPPGSTSLGTVTSDGGTYDIYKTERVNQPSIDGNATFFQYWSVRTAKRSAGTITVANHFNAWAAKGMNLGNLYEVSMTVEGYQSSGTADVKMSMR